MDALKVIYSKSGSTHDPKAHLSDMGKKIQHPENPRRFNCLLNAVKTFQTETTEQDREATDDELTAVHSLDLVNFINKVWDYASVNHKDKENVEVVPEVFGNIGSSSHAIHKSKQLHLQSGNYCFDAATPIGKTTALAARQAAAVCIDGAKSLLEGSKYVYTLCRPPGHHATRDKYGGYCYFNNVALAADHLARKGKRCVVFDIDYHHGNGTQEIFYNRDDVFFISIHADPDWEYPFNSGGSDEEGEGKGKGFNKNFPLPSGTCWEPQYKPIFMLSLELIKKYAPDYLIISLGLDPADGDPICEFHLKPNDYIQIGTELRKLNIPTLVAQEGGYAGDEILDACIKGFFQGLLTHQK